jgi:hypothetical protein
VARVGEQDANEQLGAWGPGPGGGGPVRAFPTPAACLGDAVAAVVGAVDRAAEGRRDRITAGRRRPAIAILAGVINLLPHPNPPLSKGRE